METLDEYCRKIEENGARKQESKQLFTKLIDYLRKR